MADNDDLYDDMPLTDDPLQIDDEDNTPFSEPDDVQQQLPSDHPQKDTNNDPHELYDEGGDGATDVNLPGKGYE